MDNSNVKILKIKEIIRAEDGLSISSWLTKNGLDSLKEGMLCLYPDNFGIINNENVSSFYLRANTKRGELWLQLKSQNYMDNEYTYSQVEDLFKDKSNDEYVKDYEIVYELSHEPDCVTRPINWTLIKSPKTLKEVCEEQNLYEYRKLSIYGIY